MRVYELPCICRDALSKPFPLSGARVARMRVEHEARRGAVAEGVVLLPNESNGYILGTLRFGNRLEAAGESLRPEWGITGGRITNGFDLLDPYRWRFHDFAAPTWAEAMKRAWDWAMGEVLKPEEALRKAECEACTPHEDPYVERPEEEALRRLESLGGPEDRT